MKIIIFGCGKIGTTIISSLCNEGHDIVAVDKNRKIVEEVSNIYDVMGLCGNGVDSDTMLEAGVPEAELFVAVTGSDELNMLACFLARRLGAKHTIARIRTPEYNDDSLGVLKHHLDLSLALNPDKLVAEDIFNILRFPSAVKVETFSGRNLEIVELHLKADSPFVGMKLKDLRKTYTEKFLVCNVMRDDEIIIPHGDFELKVGDIIGLTASRIEIQKLLKRAGIPQKMPESVMILGAGRISYYLCNMLISAGVDVKVVDKNRDICTEFSKLVPKAVVLSGDAMQPEVLLEEGIDSQDAFIALTGFDETNVLGSFFASGRNVPSVISKVNRPELAQTAQKLGLECIISPQKTVSDVLSRYARALHNSIGSNVERLYKLADGKAEVLEFKVLDSFEYVNIPLKELKFKKNILIAGIIRKRKPIIPAGDDVILPGDNVIVMAQGLKLENLFDIVE